MEDPTSQKKTNKFANKVALRMSISQLERVIVALLNNSQNKKFATNVAQLFGQFDDESFASDFDKQVRVTIINRIADLIMRKKIDDKDGILSFIDLSGKYEEEATKVLNKLFAYDIKAEELAELDSLISRQLKMAKIEPVVKKISDLNSQMETETYDDFSKFIEDYQQTIGDLNKGLIDARKSIEDSSKIVDFSDPSLVKVLDGMITEKNNPARKIKVGEQYINMIFNGGFEQGRSYCALGMAKSWKSGFLLNMAIEAKLYNTFPEKDGLKPAIIYLTQENSMTETMERIWARFYGNDSDFGKLTAVEAARKLEESGLFTPSKPGEARFIIWDLPSKSISTMDLAAKLADLEKDGLYPVFLVQDYLKRIRPARPNKEIRIELGDISDELHSIAIEFQMPVLSAMQLNSRPIWQQCLIENLSNCWKTLRA